MKRKNPVVISLVLMAFCLAATANAELVITEVMSKSSHSECHTDWWELTNTGSSSVNLTGYSWDDNDQVPDTHVFSNLPIDPGESVIILDQFDAYWPDLWKSFWGLGTEVTVYALIGDFGEEHLGDADGVFLYNASDALVTSATWSSSTYGFSHEWDASGTYLNLSINGENGAYESSDFSPDAGSPGYAVPEPATILVFGLGGMALLRKRRG